MTSPSSSLAVITDAAAGVGLELANLCAGHGFDLVLVDEHPSVYDLGAKLRDRGTRVDVAETDLATAAGPDRVLDIIAERSVQALLVTASPGSGKAFLDQSLIESRRFMLHTLMAPLQLIHDLGRGMRDRGEGRILLTSVVPEASVGQHATFHAARAFLDLFAFAIRTELKGSGVTVTSLMSAPEPTPHVADVADAAFAAMMRGEGDVIVDWQQATRASLRDVPPLQAGHDRNV